MQVSSDWHFYRWRIACYITPNYQHSRRHSKERNKGRKASHLVYTQRMFRSLEGNITTWKEEYHIRSPDLCQMLPQVGDASLPQIVTLEMCIAKNEHKNKVTWSVFDIVGVQTDIVSGVEQFDERAAGHIIELRFSPVTDWTQQQHEQWFDKNMDGSKYLHLCPSVFITSRRRQREKSCHFQTLLSSSANRSLTSPKTRNWMSTGDWSVSRERMSVWLTFLISPEH